MGAAGFIYYQNHVTTTPYTGRRRFMLLTSDQLFSMSQQLYSMVSDAAFATVGNLLGQYVDKALSSVSLVPALQH